LKSKRGTLWPKISTIHTIDTTRAQILQEAMATELIPPPRKARTPYLVDKSKHCQYHKNHGHHTEECVALKDQIEELVEAGQLRRFVRDGGIRIKQSTEPRGRGSVSRREEKFERREAKRVERRDERIEVRVERRDERGSPPKGGEAVSEV